MKRHVTGI